MIKGDWKLLVRNLKSRKEPLSIELYDLNVDISESNDLSEENPELVHEMLDEMKQSHVHSKLFSFPGLKDFYSNFPPDHN